MGQIKNIKLHIVTDIKKLTITQTQPVETKYVSKSVTSAHLQYTQDMEFHSSEMTARSSNSVVVNVTKRLRQRNPRKVRWTKAFRKSNGKELTIDPSLEFEKKRNTPMVYNREMWSKTVDAVKRIEEIKTKRQNHFIKNRLKVGKKLAKEVDMKEIQKNIKLIQTPVKPKAKVAIVEEEDNRNANGYCYGDQLMVQQQRQQQQQHQQQQQQQ